MPGRIQSLEAFLTHRVVKASDLLTDVLRVLSLCVAALPLGYVEPALEFHGVNMPTTPAGSITGDATQPFCKLAFFCCNGAGSAG
jgi:hypothetical protein